jgi:hypothetical protein
MENIPDSLCGKMSLEHSRQTKVRTLRQSSKKSAKSKMKDYLFLNLKVENGLTQGKSWEMRFPFVGESLMLNTGECPNEERESTLSQILQANVPTKYYLSQKACLGILRRASARGKQLPQMLRIALEQQALTDTMQN